MNNIDEIKNLIKDKYGNIALKAKSAKNSCSCSCCSDSTIDFTNMSDNYNNVIGYIPEADLGLGCGLPTEFANIKEGDTVLDLGSGAGNDVFIARRIVGENGIVIGLDMTKEMVDRAILNCAILGYTNVEFIYGDIENIPLNNDFVDVVISNCVLNLVPNKSKAFSEIYRVLRSGGHFCISDIVLDKELPNSLKDIAALYTGCISGAINLHDYLEIVKMSGFSNIEIKKSKEIIIPNTIIKSYLSDDDFKKGKVELGIRSITLVAEK